MTHEPRARASERRATRAKPAALVGVVLGVLLLVGCASVRSARDSVGGWFGGSDEPAVAPSPEPPRRAAKKPAPKPAVSAAPETDPESAVDAEPAAEPEAPVPPVEPQAPERSIFDPY